METSNVKLYSETRTIETISFENENTLVIAFTDGTHMRVLSATPLACIQGSQESTENPNVQSIVLKGGYGPPADGSSFDSVE
jgi:hypothetical protein